MQIRDDLEPLPEKIQAGRRGPASIQRLVLRDPSEDETVRMPLSVLAFWRELENSELDETLQIRLDLPEYLEDDDETPADPFDG
jgi:hypothetical protein